jgi:hypothetical protein
VSASFNAANQAKLAIKMKCSQFSWYRSSHIEAEGDEYIVVISITVPVNDAIRKTIPPVYEGVSVKTTTNGR